LGYKGEDMLKHQRFLIEIYRNRSRADLDSQDSVKVPAINLQSEPVKTEEIEMVVDDVFLMYKDGRLISHHTRKLRPDRDDQILTSMFTAVKEFITQSFGGDEDEDINEIAYGRSKILIEYGKHVVIAAVVSGEGTKRMHNEIQNGVKHIEVECGVALEKWSGDAKELKASQKWVQMLAIGEHITPLKSIETQPNIASAPETPPTIPKMVQPNSPQPPQKVIQPNNPPPSELPIKAPESHEDAVNPRIMEQIQSPLPLGAQPIGNPFRDETDALGTLSSLPRGLPASLSGKSMDELAEALSKAEFAETAEGDIIVRIRKKWYHGDAKEVDTYLQPYKGP
jgi:hypothetical protein